MTRISPGQPSDGTPLLSTLPLTASLCDESLPETVQLHTVKISTTSPDRHRLPAALPAKTAAVPHGGREDGVDYYTI